MSTVDSIEVPLTELAKRIREARKRVHLSQAALAAGIGVSDKAVSAYEQARSVPPFEKLKKIANYTNHPVTYFTDDTPLTSTIASKLALIETELAEIKRLLKQAESTNSKK